MIVRRSLLSFFGVGFVVTLLLLTVSNILLGEEDILKELAFQSEASIVLTILSGLGIALLVGATWLSAGKIYCLPTISGIGLALPIIVLVQGYDFLISGGVFLLTLLGTLVVAVCLGILMVILLLLAIATP
jgi:hypothetical protein